ASWKAPPKDQWNGELEGYYIGYRAVGSKQPFSFRSEVATPNKDSSHKYEFFLSNLMKATTYDIVLKAFNSAGSGPQSHEVQVTTLDGDLPSAPKAFVVSSTKTAITVSWNLHEPQADRPLIIGSIIHYQRENDEWRQIPVPIASSPLPSDSANSAKGTTHTYVIDGLDSGVRYNLFVTATNRHGEGDPSSILSTKTDGDNFELLGSMGNPDAPYYFQPIFVIPIVVSIVIVFIVIAATIICVRRLKPPVIPNDAFNTLSAKQFAYAGTMQRYVDFENSKPLMNECGNGYPLPYSTMTMDSSENLSNKMWEKSVATPSRRNSLNKESHCHIYDNPH
ncbi:Down syndrome cell adhesion molecule-like protein 1, partial [Leptotrombidium deliense]